MGLFSWKKGDDSKNQHEPRSSSPTAMPLPTISKDAPKPSPPQVRKAPTAPKIEGLAGVKNIIAISSGKGGVGKSTVSVNLALAMSHTKARVGLMDADVYGPSVPKMLAGQEEPSSQNGKILPVSRYDVKFMSMGLLTGQDTPVIWRGPMATKLIQQFLSGVEWGELDYLLIDLPPGTGDVQLTLTQSAPLTGAVIVTTPQEVAVGITMRGIRMFEEVKVPIIGLIENMSGFICPHCNQETQIFRHGGGIKAAKEVGIRFLGSIPIDPKLVLAGDKGEPVVGMVGENRPISALAFDKIAKDLISQINMIQQETKNVEASPSEITNDESDVMIVWPDQTTRHPFRELRLACACAECVDEITGEKRLNESKVPTNVHPLRYKSIGRYGVQISWSDGHGTGIYTFNRLRKMVTTT